MLLLSGFKLVDVLGSSMLIPVVLAAGAALIVWLELKRLNGRVAAFARGRSPRLTLGLR